MRLKDYAEKVLFGTKLEDKLFRPDTLEDSSALYTGMLPKTPSRPQKLILSENLKSESSFPKVSDLEDPNKVALVMHYFANHELLAMEIMALVLLKFPDAPKAFRMGVAKEMREEAEHMEMYIHRMNSLGMEFGELKLNDFFWRNLSGMEHPVDFCSKMGITFEQANLDFSKYFLNQFEQLGDFETRDILEKVYLDEISHVGFGLHWFKKWMKDPKDLFEAHKNSLELPMGLQRAKATTKLFDREARFKAGFDKNYVDKLELFTSSRGRPPVLRYFNPEVEEELASLSNTYSPKKLMKNLKTSLEHFMWIVSKNQDVVFVENNPSGYFLKHLKAARIDYPEYESATTRKNLLKQISKRKFEKLEPWGISPKSLKIEKEKQNCFQNLNTDLDGKLLNELHSQVYSLKLLEDFLVKYPEYDELLLNKEEIAKEFSCPDKALQYTKSFERFVVKAPLGLSGRGVFFFNQKEEKIAKQCIESVLEKQNVLLVEKYHERVFDFSLQIYCNEKDSKYKYKLARFFSGKSGEYSGGVVGRDLLAGLPTELRQFWNYEGKKPNLVLKLLDDLTNFVASKYALNTYHSAIGIDCFVFRDLQGNYKIRPLVEVNCRYNMGFLKTRLSPLVSSKSCGVYKVVQRKNIAKFDTPKSFINLVEREFPLCVNNKNIESGFLFLSDPYAPGDFMAALMISSNLEEAQKSWNKLLS